MGFISNKTSPYLWTLILIILYSCGDNAHVLDGGLLLNRGNLGSGNGSVDGGSGSKIPGCTSSIALNQSSTHIEDGSCQFQGCFNSESLNFESEKYQQLLAYFELLNKKNIKFSGKVDSSACDPKDGDEQKVKGCLNFNAQNYNPLAKEEDGSCLFNGCFDDKYQEYEKVKDQLIKQYLVELENLKITFTGNIKNDLCKTKVDDSKVLGCTNIIASNYNSLATVEDGSCQFVGCFDQQYQEFDADRNDQLISYLELLKNKNIEHTGSISNELCKSKVDDKIKGCMISFATNYNPRAVTEDGSCKFKTCIYACYANFNSVHAYLILNYIKKYQLQLADVLECTCNKKETISTSTRNLCYWDEQKQTPEFSVGQGCQGSQCQDDFNQNALSKKWSAIDCDFRSKVTDKYVDGNLVFESSNFDFNYYIDQIVNPTPAEQIGKAGIYLESQASDFNYAVKLSKLDFPDVLNVQKLSKYHHQFSNKAGIVASPSWEVPQFNYSSAHKFSGYFACGFEASLENIKKHPEIQLKQSLTAYIEINGVRHLVGNANTSSKHFWTRMERKGNIISCYFSTNEQIPNPWKNKVSATIHGWNGSTATNGSFGPEADVGIYVQGLNLSSAYFDSFLVIP